MPLSDETIIEEAREAFQRAAEAEAENRRDALDDLRFARLGEQWPDKIRRERDLEGRPCLTINRLPAFIRQVVNDARQNKPAIAVHPVDDGADPETAEVFNGLIRHIEQSSDAEVAYDTALDFAVTSGVGYFRINTRYATDDGFDQDLAIERVANPFGVYGDPDSTAADSSDWNTAFVVDRHADRPPKLRKTATNQWPFLTVNLSHPGLQAPFPGRPLTMCLLEIGGLRPPRASHSQEGEGPRVAGPGDVGGRPRGRPAASRTPRLSTKGSRHDRPHEADPAPGGDRRPGRA